MSRVWMITGASSGFGRALLDAVLDRGETAVAAVRRPETLAEVAAAHPDQVDVVALDVSDVEAVDAVVADVVDRHGAIDVLVNNAGRTHVGSVEETTDAELRSLFDVHLFGPAALVRAVLPGWRERRSGVVVQMSSLGGQLSFAGFGAYSATKAALEGMSEALAEEVAPYGIRVLVVEPGAFRTGLFAAAGTSAATDAYAGTVGSTRAMVSDDDGVQPGDPAKAAAAILTVLDADDPPFRLALGGDAVDAIRDHCRTVERDLASWESVSRSTTFDD